MTLAAAYAPLIAAVTIWRESRGESFDAQRAVGWVIMNRIKDPRWPNEARGVCLQPNQFSCWNVSDPNYRQWPAITDASFLSCCHAWEEPGEDITKGATSYHSGSWERLPESARRYFDRTKITVQIGAFTFYKL